MIYKENELSAVMGTFIPNRLNVTLQQEVGFNIKDGNFSIPEHEAIFVHEKIHFFQTAFTGYGQTTWSQYRQMVKDVEAEWQKITRSISDSKKIIPLGHIAKIGNKTDKERALLLYKFYNELLRMQTLRSVGDSGYDLLSDYNISLCNKNWQINPFIYLNERKYKLQGKDILESQAKFIEAVYAYIYHRVPLDETIDIQKLPETYWVPYIWFLRQVGSTRMLEFPLICDLALQTVWDDPPKTEEDWKNSHPAWRFIKLVEAAKVVDAGWCEDLEKIKLNYKKYADRILEICKYRPLDEIIEMSLKYYNYEGNTNLAIDQIMKEALLYRQKNLWCAANPFVDLDIWEEMNKKFMPPSIQFGNIIKIVPPGGNVLNKESKEARLLGYEHTIELHLQALIAQIIGRVSDFSMDIDHLQCGLGYFGIKDICDYQKEGICQGSFNPKEGTAAPIKIRGEEVVGCQFEAVLFLRGIKVKDIELNFRNREMVSEEGAVDDLNADG